MFLTKDGKVVVNYDAPTARTSDRNMTITTARTPSWSRLMLPGPFRAANGLTTEEVPVERMPLLKDILQMVKSSAAHACPSSRRRPPWPTHGGDRARAWYAGVGRFQRRQSAADVPGQLARPEPPVFWDTSATENADEPIATAAGRGFESIVMNQAAVSSESIPKILAVGLGGRPATGRSTTSP